MASTLAWHQRLKDNSGGDDAFILRMEEDGLFGGNAVRGIWLSGVRNRAWNLTADGVTCGEGALAMVKIQRKMKKCNNWQARPYIAMKKAKEEAAAHYV